MNATSPPRDRIARHRAAQRERGLRAVVLWLPNVNDSTYRTKIDDECRRLAVPSHDETFQAEAYFALAADHGEWR